MLSFIYFVRIILYEYVRNKIKKAYEINVPILCAMGAGNRCDIPEFKVVDISKTFNDVVSLRPKELQLGFLKVLKGSYMYENREKKEKHEKAGQYGNLTKLDSTPSSTSFCNDRFNDTSHCVETNNAPKNNLRNFFKIGAIGALIIAFVIGMVFL